jgi:exopolysaccharide biosynthesis protein
VGGFPVLLAGGAMPTALATSGAESFRGVNPRTAVGLDASGRRLWLVVLDGRRAGWSVGTTLEETARVLGALGATEALNLDGGGSSALVVRDGATGATRVVTRPSDPTGERAVGNALAVLGGCPAR